MKLFIWCEGIGKSWYAGIGEPQLDSDCGYKGFGCQMMLDVCREAAEQLIGRERVEEIQDGVTPDRPLGVFVRLGKPGPIMERNE